MKTVYEYGSPSASRVLIQMVDDHDLDLIDNEVSLLQSLSGKDFHLLAVKVDCWNHDLSPWNAPAVFGSEAFGNGAESTLSEVLELTKDSEKDYYVGGYSLAGLFALWAVYQTNAFKGVAAASPSVWFPGFLDYVKANEIRTPRVYLSLGDREDRTRNPVMATVSDRIREMHDLLTEREVTCSLEWYPGNHFKDPDLRTAKAFAWLLHDSEIQKAGEL